MIGYIVKNQVYLYLEFALAQTYDMVRTEMITVCQL